MLNHRCEGKLNGSWVSLRRGGKEGGGGGGVGGGVAVSVGLVAG